MNHDRAQMAVVIGSPRGPEASSSARLARVIAEKLEAAHWGCEWFHAHRAAGSQDAWADMLASVAKVDLILIASPLYVDGLPAPLVQVLSRLRDERDALQRDGNPPRLLGLMNCGFVEPDQNQCAQLMLRAFSDEMGFQWAGGLSLGMGGRLTKPLRIALDRVAESLREDILIPDSVATAMTTPVLRPWLYVLGGNAMWGRLAKANGLSRKSLGARPYEGLA